MAPRHLPILGLCLMSALSFAAAPRPDAIAEYESANQAMDELQRGYAQLQDLPAETEADRAKGRARVDELSAMSARMYEHLDNAIAAGHAVAMYQKAKMLAVKTIGKGNKAVCDLYGQAAELGLMAGALEYAKCLNFYPETAEYNRRLEILKVAVEGQDPYAAEYPLMTSFPYCFPKNKPALKPGEDAIAWVADNARPLALSAEDFRAEGYYTLAMTGPDEQTKEIKAGFLRSAFAHGCREDSARIGRHLGVTPPGK
ncbi:hypothetical protein RJC98_28880 [Pseudomonas allii]|uniref:Uncharacterized protein n=1 Tax=Pseudomonas allii TaxID=2740531 RepID=A0ACC6LLT5_9PSED|nr:hypothetical protein [Pseudomonas allii]MDR9879214.1 hypothetical protein [Pseudomonas allii]